MQITNAKVTPTILLVEDEENDVLFMKMAMERAGIAGKLQVAEDGGEAIEYLSGNGAYADRLRHPLPAVVLLDLKLPRVMGMDVLKWIRERREFNLIVVIILTSSQQRSDIELTASLHANSYLLKPSNPLDLNELAALLKQYWLQLNQPTATLGMQAAPSAPR